MQTSKYINRLVSCISLMGIVSLAPRPAAARPEAPGMLQEAADMKCVPLCTVCHQTNPGVKSNWGRGPSIDAGLRQVITDEGSQAQFTAAYKTWASANVAAANDLKNGILTGIGDICGPTYGCAMRMEKDVAPSRDVTGPLFIVGAMVVGGLLRRRRGR